MPIYILIEIDTDLRSGQHHAQATAYRTRRRAEQALRDQYAEAYHGLHLAGEAMTVADQGFTGEKLATATIVTEHDEYEWKIEEGTVQ